VSDDHLIYVPRDGTRGFTNTVSGVDPVADYHLATKYYIDTISGTLHDQLPLAVTHILGAKGDLGAGAGWADNGLIEDLPVILFSDNTNQRMTLTYRAIDTMDLTYDPIVIISSYSTAAPQAGDKIRWKCKAKYIYYGESPNKAADQIAYSKQTLDDSPSYLFAETRNKDIEFTLSGTLMQKFDVMYLTMERQTSDPIDNYSNDFALGEVWLHYHIKDYSD
jgi:hypothetical protein